MPQQYFVTYTTQASVNDVVFHSEIIRLSKIDPIQWIEQKNATEKTKYSLIMFEEYAPFKMGLSSRKVFISYVSQQGIGNILFKTERLIRQNPMTWVLDKNKSSSKIKYALINWWEQNR